MGLFDMLNKNDIKKKYLSIGDKRLDEEDMLERKDLYEIFKKYQGYEKTIDLSDNKEVNKKILSLMSELFNLKIVCKNYNEYEDLYNNFNEITINKINTLNILECMALITYIQRQDYWSGGYSSPYLNNTKNGFIPQIINRIISLYESRGK
ncbi:MAG: hypothetical protein IJ134_04320 [Bacilli bacterium]|nr:hypothetical protein [Bacilli bacterium]